MCISGNEKSTQNIWGVTGGMPNRQLKHKLWKHPMIYQNVSGCYFISCWMLFFHMIKAYKFDLFFSGKVIEIIKAYTACSDSKV